MDKLKDTFYKHLAQTTLYPMDLEVVSAQGSYVQTKDGREYLDFISGIAVSNLGHRHPRIIKAIQDQVDKHLFVMVYGEFVTESQVKLAQKLTSLLPNPIDNVYFTSTGTEAIEGALKLAKRYTGRHKIVSFKKSYHGSTHGSLSVSGNEYKKYAFRPLLPEVYHIHFNHTDELDIIDETTACVIVESVQGDAGVRIPDQSFMTALRKKCSDTGTLLIIDEIQTGMGRTGKMFAFQHFNIVPDIVVMGKALGGGLPLGAFASSTEIMRTLTSDPMLGHITTFGGNPVSCAASLGFLEAMQEEKIIDSVEEKGKYLMQYLNHSGIVEVRRKGMMFAIEFENAEIVAKIVNLCLEKGLICFWFLSCPEAFRIAPPLNMSKEDLDKGGRIISAAISDVLV